MQRKRMLSSPRKRLKTERKRLIPKPTPVPPWEGMIEAWSKGWVAKNYWKVQSLFDDPQDALQECALVYTIVKNTYEHTVDNPAWFMSLYQTSLARAWIHHARASSEIQKAKLRVLPDVDNHVDYNAGPALHLISKAPVAVQEVLRTLATATDEKVRQILTPSKIARTEHTAEAILSENICKSVGVEADNIVRDLSKALQG